MPPRPTRRLETLDTWRADWEALLDGSLACADRIDLGAKTGHGTFPLFREFHQLNANAMSFRVVTILRCSR